MSNFETTPSHDTRATLPVDTTLDTLIDKLTAGKIPLDEYGVGNAKTVYHLLSEINEGESIVTIDKANNVFREVGVLWTDVLCQHSNGNVYILREDRQEFNDGRVRRRNLDASIGEKLKPAETPINAVDRALREELSVETTDSIYHVGYDEKTFIPDTFPGIESTYKMHKFVTVIPESEFKPEGYVEYQKDKTNYYVWELAYPPAEM